MKLFVWDFHGTLEKGNENAVFVITNKILEMHGYKRRMSKRENLLLYGRKWFEYFQYLLPRELINKCIELQNACVSYEGQNSHIVRSHIRQNDFVGEVLFKIKNSGHDQVLISNTSRIALPMFMKSVQISNFFPMDKKAFATNSHRIRTKKTKKDKLARYLSGRNFDSIVTIGDKGVDVELARNFGGISYLYAHPGKKFFDCDADYKIRDLREVLREI